jgi:hypothetical protein
MISARRMESPSLGCISPGWSPFRRRAGAPLAGRSPDRRSAHGNRAYASAKVIACTGGPHRLVGQRVAPAVLAARRARPKPSSSETNAAGSVRVHWQEAMHTPNRCWRAWSYSVPRSPGDRQGEQSLDGAGGLGAHFIGGQPRSASLRSLPRTGSTFAGTGPAPAHAPRPWPAACRRRPQRSSRSQCSVPSGTPTAAPCPGSVTPSTRA